MKVVDVRSFDNKCVFGDIPPFCCFEHGGFIWLKIPITLDGKNAVLLNANAPHHPQFHQVKFNDAENADTIPSELRVGTYHE